MNPEAINRRIAELCGWKAFHMEDRCDGTIRTRCGACGREGHSNCYGDGTGQIEFSCADMPCCDEAQPKNYFNSLDCCREFERNVQGDDRSLYIDMIYLLVSKSADNFEQQWAIFNASPPQRCEAFLRMKGEWVE